MAIKRTVAMAGVVSAVLIAGSSTFAMANGILGGHRADPVGSFETVALDVDTEPTTAGSVPAGADPTVPAQPGSSAPGRSTPDQAPRPGVAPAPPPATPPALAPVPVTAPSGRSSGTTPVTVEDHDEDEHDDEYDDEYEKPEHEDEHESEDDDHHGRDDDD